jgi:hypothetical protein
LQFPVCLTDGDIEVCIWPLTVFTGRFSSEETIIGHVDWHKSKSVSVQFAASIFRLDLGERVPMWLNKLCLKLDGLRYAFCNDTGAPKIQAAKERTTK